MFTLGIPLKQKRRTLGYLSNEYFPGGMKKLGQQVPYEIISTDRKGGFFIIGFPNMDHYEYSDIVLKLKQQGVTVIGADSQLTENKIMKLINLVPLQEKRLQPPKGFTGELVKKLVQADKDTIFFANGKYYQVDETAKQDYVDSLFVTDITDGDGRQEELYFSEIEFAEGGAIRPQFIPGLNEGRINGPFNYKTLADIAYKDDSALAFVDGEHVALFSDGFSPEDPEHFIALRKDGEEVVVMYDEVEFVETSTVDEGSCGYAPDGEDPNKADQPAGSHLLRKEIRKQIKQMMESFADDPNVPGITGMEDSVNNPSVKAEKILNQLAKSFGDIPLNKVINDTTYKRQAITAILFGMMNEDAS